MSSSGGTEAEIYSFFKRSGRNWNQMCQATMWQLCAHFGHAPVTYPSARAAYEASHIDGHNPLDAPSGSFHYWDIGRDGHVAAQLLNGHVLMGSTHIDTSWGINVGLTTVARYNSRVSGERYLGWSRTNGRNDFAVFAPKPTARKSTTAQPGEGLYAVADRTGVSYSKLLQLNPGIHPSGLMLGQRIWIS